MFSVLFCDMEKQDGELLRRHRHVVAYSVVVFGHTDGVGLQQRVLLTATAQKIQQPKGCFRTNISRSLTGGGALGGVDLCHAHIIVDLDNFAPHEHQKSDSHVIEGLGVCVTHSTVSCVLDRVFVVNLVRRQLRSLEKSERRDVPSRIGARDGDHWKRRVRHALRVFAPGSRVQVKGEPGCAGA